MRIILNLMVIIIIAALASFFVSFLNWVKKKINEQKIAEQEKEAAFERMILASAGNKPDCKKEENSSATITVNSTSYESPIISASFETVQKESVSTYEQGNPIIDVVRKLTQANLLGEMEGYLTEKGVVDYNSQIIKLKNKKTALILASFPDKERVIDLNKKFDLLIISGCDRKILIIESMGDYIADRYSM